ncbi:DinB family protein [Flavitalea antarctica]
MSHEQQISTGLILDAWNLQIKRANNLFNYLSAEQLQSEIAPDRNRGVYLLGHLTAVHDTMLPLLNLNERLYPLLDNIFIENPDKSFAMMPSTHDLKFYWNQVNETLAAKFTRLEPSDWLKKHNEVNAEDFKKEPHRNRLNVLINRTNHLSYHLGQLTLLKNKS